MPPPAQDARVRWPEAFGTRFVVFVDTEEEFDWRAPLSRDHRAVTAAAAIPEGHRRFADAGVPLTYLVDHPIVSDAAAVAAIARALEDGVSAVGTQLHAWVNPPFEEAVTPANSYAGNLPRALEAAKLAVLTQAIAAAFGTRPLAYRAGRYGIGPDTLALLAAEGYRLDTSVRARYDYRADGGPDFRAIGNHAYRCGPEDALIELPFTTVFTGAARAAGARLHDMLDHLPRGHGIASRLRLLSRVSLTPEAMPIDEAIEAVRIAAGEGVAVLNFAFHSPSLVPGHTPYVRDAADLAAFWLWWERMLAALDRLGVRAASLDTLLAAACGNPGASASSERAGGL